MIAHVVQSALICVETDNYMLLRGNVGIITIWSFIVLKMILWHLIILNVIKPSLLLPNNFFYDHSMITSRKIRKITVNLL